ncbi:hypothetical protein B0H11DRAFT_1217700 [Mycena galericulata]|nr:hypothetical protein B0H11DRAFT_1217700 [Mycena galericulata]
MAKFTLTRAHVDAILDSTKGLDPILRKDPENLAGWMQEVTTPMQPKFKSELKMFVSSVDVIGNKAILEVYGEATQANGNPYNNNYAWFLILSADTGGIVEIREYEY